MGELGGPAAVNDWLAGLPADDELTPLSQSLVPSKLAAAFGIKPDPPRTPLDVVRASRDSFSSLRPENSSSKPSDDEDDDEEPASRTDDENAGRAPKRARLVWTPQLHKRFVDVVAHLGIKNAVPKTIMQLMNVEGLTRENVASHLQKYRLYLKRMQGLPVDSPVDQQLFAGPAPAPVPGFVPVPVAVVPVNGQIRGGAFRGYEAHHPYPMLGGRPVDSWPTGQR